MATKKQAGAAPVEAAALPDLATVLDRLRSVAGLADEALSQIEGVTTLALHYMESPEAYRHPEPIAQALTAILHKVWTLQDCIHDQAEEVGCASPNEAMSRRTRASTEASEAESARAAATRHTPT